MLINLDYNEVEELLEKLGECPLSDRIKMQYKKAKGRQNIGKPKSERESFLDYKPGYGDKIRK